MRRKFAKLYGVDERVFLPRLPHLKINITYRCDRGCTNCNRLTGLCPSTKEQELTPGQIADMLADCVKYNKTWTRITLTGGEPTMHDGFEDIVDILMAYKKMINPELKATTYTYHHPKYYYKIENVIKKYPDFEIKDTRKDKPRVHKIAYMKAPIDIDPKKYNDQHLYTGCNEGARLCGIGWDFSGYYVCPIMASISRVIKLDVAIKSIKDLTVKNLVKQYNPICKYCGCYAYYKAKVNKDLISPTWAEAIRLYKMDNQ